MFLVGIFSWICRVSDITNGKSAWDGIWVAASTNHTRCLTRMVQFDEVCHSSEFWHGFDHHHAFQPCHISWPKNYYTWVGEIKCSSTPSPPSNTLCTEHYVMAPLVPKSFFTGLCKTLPSGVGGGRGKSGSYFMFPPTCYSFCDAYQVLS